MTGSDVTTGALWTLLIASVILTPRALGTESWQTMWVAALLSATVSIAGVMSIGSITFLLTCLQLTSAAALRWSVDRNAWLFLTLLGAVVWTIVVPAQLLIGTWLSWLVAFPVMTIIGTMALISRTVPCGRVT